jgi:hypothetical protein
MVDKLQFEQSFLFGLTVRLLKKKVTHFELSQSFCKAIAKNTLKPKDVMIPKLKPKCIPKLKPKCIPKPKFRPKPKFSDHYQ